MQKVSELVGKAIVSSDNGERLGRVADVLLDTQSNRVLGLVIAGGAFGSEQVLPFADVQTLGADAVVARTSKGVLAAKQWRQQGIDSARSSNLNHKRVLTTGGRAIGEIRDVLLDDAAGVVEAFEVVSPGRLGGLMQRRGLLQQDGEVRIGADAVLVSEAAAAALEEPGRYS